MAIEPCDDAMGTDRETDPELGEQAAGQGDALPPGGEPLLADPM